MTPKTVFWDTGIRKYGSKEQESHTIKQPWSKDGVFGHWLAPVLQGGPWEGLTAVVAGGNQSVS